LDVAGIAMSHFDHDSITICLYVAIPEAEESRTETKPLLRRLKSLVKNSLDRWLTRFSGRLHLDLYHYETARGFGGESNRGDIAIRMAIKQQLVDAFAPRPVRFYEVKWGDLSDAVAEDVNRCCDLFVIGGGGYMFLKSDGSAGHMLESVEDLSKIRCPVYAYGIGLNRLMHEQPCDLRGLPPASVRKIRYLADRCALIGVRDLETAHLIENYSAKRPTLTGDPALFYTHKHVAPLRYRERPRIGINLAAHGWRALAVLKPLLPAIIALLKIIQRDADLIYLQHHDLEQPVIDFLRFRGLKFKVVYGTPGDLLDGYTETDLVICQMLHSCILAANVGTPFLNIAYDEKIVAFCNLMGVPQACIPHGSANLATLEKAFAALFERRLVLREALDRRKKLLRGSMTLFARQIVAETEDLESAGHAARQAATVRLPFPVFAPAGDAGWAVRAH